MIKMYYKSQMIQGYLLLFIGVLSSILPIYFIFFQTSSFYFGAALIFLIFGVYQIFLGIFHGLKADVEIEKVKKQIEKNTIKEGEIFLIEKYLKLNTWYIFIYSTLIIIATVCIFGFPQMVFLRGLSISLFVHATILITAQFNVNQKRKIYFKWLNDFYN